MQAVHLTAYGDPAKFLQPVELPEPREPAPGQVLIQVDFSPLNPNDLMLAQGIYSVHPWGRLSTTMKLGCLALMSIGAKSPSHSPTPITPRNSGLRLESGDLSWVRIAVA
jgi:hypothetical protein